MANSRRKRFDRACLHCQKRKTKCVPSNDQGTCTYCLKWGKSCSFETPPSRTPLTRKNLDDLEARYHKLTALIHKLQPGININDIMDDLSEQAHLAPVHSRNNQPELGVSDEESEHMLLRNEFEWQEIGGTNSEQIDLSRDHGRDGMASLSARNDGTGYLGETAGSSILESVSSMLRPEAQTKPRQSAPDPGRLQDNANHNSIEPFGGSLNASVLQNHLIDLYFTSYNMSYPILHERSFRTQHRNRRQMSANSTWHIIHYMVLAIGEWVGGYCVEDQSVYYDAARSRLRIDILESGTLDTVQAFLLLGNYLQKRDRPNTGYNFIGIAYRIALGLGLHREIPVSGRAATFLQQRRRLLFWTLYSFESGFSITTGRPTLVSDAFIDVQKPQNLDDSHCSASSGLLHEVDCPTGSTLIAALAHLAVVANKIYTDFLSARNCSQANHQLAVLEQAIRIWRDSLPAYFWDNDVPSWFRAPRQVILWKEQNLRILLLLAGQRHHFDEDDKAALGARCQTMAVQTIFDIVEFCDIHVESLHQGISWYAVYFILQAALVLCVHQLRRRNKRSSHQDFELQQSVLPPPEWEGALNRARECLRRLGLSNPAAKRTLKMLDRLFQHVQTDNRAPIAEPNILQSLTPDITTNTSSSHTIATNLIDRQWIAAIDPSLHMFLDSNQSIDGVFEDLEGFPNTTELENFAYMTSSMHTMRGDMSTNEWLDFGTMGDMHNIHFTGY